MENKDKQSQPMLNQDFYQALAKKYTQMVIELEVDKELTPDEFIKNCNEGATALSYCPPSLNPISFITALEALAKLSLDFQPEKQREIGQIQKQLNSYSQEELEEKLNQVLSGKDIGKVFSLEEYEDAKVASTLITLTLKPFLKAYGQYIMENLPLKEWKKSYCPTCGHSAGLAILTKDQDGKRHLWCPLCESRWAYKRIGCPACEEDNPDNLGYFRVEETEDGYRVNYCKKCNSYIKTYDEQKRISENKDWFIEDKKTGYLDFLAIKEGFKPIE